MTQEKPKRRWLPWVRDIGIAIVLVTLFQWWQTRDVAGGLAPDLSGTLVSGQIADLKTYQGKPVLVHFWATWCPICRAEDGNIHNLAQDYAVLTVATNSGDASEIQHYLDENKLDFPVLLDEDGSLGAQWGVNGVPSSFVLNGKGEIRSVAVGYTTEIGLRIRMLLAGG